MVTRRLPTPLPETATGVATLLGQHGSRPRRALPARSWAASVPSLTLLSSHAIVLDEQALAFVRIARWNGLLTATIPLRSPR